MDEEQLIRLVDSGKYISGVHNYCDRWCERCPLASKCIVRAMELEDDAALEAAGKSNDADARNEAFWQRLSDSFACTHRMIEKYCKENGIEITEADLKAAGAEERQRRIKVQRSALSKQGMKYGDLVDKWFKKNPTLMEEKEKMLQSIADLELPGHAPARDAEQIIDAVEVVRWYQYFVGIKTTRAVSGLVEIEADGGDEDGVGQSDADGSAKIALIGIDRSLAAWAMLREHFPDEGDRILDVLVELDKLRRAIERTFPKAREFKRPGFDE